MKKILLIGFLLIVGTLAYSEGDHDGKRTREEMKIEEERAKEEKPVVKPAKSLEDIVEEKKQNNEHH